MKFMRLLLLGSLLKSFPWSMKIVKLAEGLKFRSFSNRRRHQISDRCTTMVSANRGLEPKNHSVTCDIVNHHESDEGNGGGSCDIVFSFKSDRKSGTTLGTPGFSEQLEIFSAP
jgi:hypothetical protein